MALAAEHQKEGRLEEAEKLYRRILRHNPRNVDALRLLALIALQAGHDGEAESLLQQAHHTGARFRATRCSISAGCARSRIDTREALECFDRALALDPANAQAHYLRASTLAPAAFTHEAIEAYERCLELRPEHIGALLGLGHVLKAVGRYRRCRGGVQRLHPGAAGVSARPTGASRTSRPIASTMRWSREMEQRVADGGLTVQSEVNFLFALGKALRGPRRLRARLAVLQRRATRSNAPRSRTIPVQTEAMNDRIVEVFSAEFLQSRQGVGHPGRRRRFSSSGLPRSGSTLLEQILASHSQVEGTSELPYLGRVATWLNRNRAGGHQLSGSRARAPPQDFQALGADYLAHARMHRRTSAPRFIDKMPNNFPNIGLLSLILPNARIIDARRHPLDACLSCYRQLFAKGQAFTYDLTEIGEYYLQYQRMMDHWASVLARAEC